MPYVNVRVAGTITYEQKEKIAHEISETLERVINKPKSATYITFDEVPRENWAVGGNLLGKKD
ncbi:MAG: 4-oxalocrotonate tautomerase family protein [Nitrosomonas sp.]|nr:4-oxalocrotonate tautomerase family protein [Nitrosomonas sp.]